VAYTDKWDVINLSHALLSSEEADEREEALAEVMDPMFLFSRAEAEAEAEGEGDAEGEIQVDDTVPVVATNGDGQDLHTPPGEAVGIEIAT
jgi:RNA polymerase II-associated factor 1